jgi:hypothetical protein
MVLGTISTTDCPNHATVVYQYTIGDVTYTSKGASSDDGIMCDRARPGDSIHIYVDPESPKVSIIGAPERRLRDFPVAIVVIPGMAIAAGILGYALQKLRRTVPTTDA